MSNHRRRLDRLEQNESGNWSLTDILLWMSGERGGTPGGPLWDLLATLPVKTPREAGQV
jgi:hypothetical protein